MTRERFASCTPKLPVYLTISGMPQLDQAKPNRTSTHPITILYRTYKPGAFRQMAAKAYANSDTSKSTPLPPRSLARS